MILRTTHQGLSWSTRRSPLAGLMVGNGFGQFGNAIAALALPWFTLSTTRDPVWVGAVSAAGTVALIGGSLLSSRLFAAFRARSLAIAADVLSAASMAAIPLLFLGGSLTLPLLLALVVLGALFDGPGIVAREIHYPELARLGRVPVERATAIDELMDNGAIILGPPIAGIIIISAGMAPTLWATAVCSLFSALLTLIALPARARPSRSDHQQDFFAGVRFLISKPAIRELLLFTTPVITILGAMFAVVLPVLFGESGQGPLGLAGLLAAAGVTATVSALVFARWGQHADRRAILVASSIGSAIGCALLTVHLSGPVVLLAGAVLGLASGPIGPLLRSTILRTAPASIRDGVVSATITVALCATPCAALTSGMALHLVGVRPVLLGISGIFSVLLIFAFLSSSLRQISLEASPRGVSAFIKRRYSSGTGD